ncbi:MAG: hypothetical protein IJ439_05475 [Tyzzerella sp.]|nr:hypothetical protein [Tyzzerella sp.]
MAIEVGSEKVICPKCGTAYGRRKGYFGVSYAELHKGLGYIPWCRDCVDKLYSSYLAQCNDVKIAVRQVCRKLDLYWNETVFENVMKKSSTQTVMTQYMAKLTGLTYAGKSYDDTLLEEGTLWIFNDTSVVQDDNIPDAEEELLDDTEEYIASDEVMAFWGAGYTPSMYQELEQRRSYWMSRFPEDMELDIGTEALIRQICNLEIDINRDRVAGKSIDKSVNALNNLLGSASLKPNQKKEDADASLMNTPMGVWLYRFEQEKPLPEIDDDLKDVNRLKKYVFTWMGHLCKMMGIKDGYTRLYEAEIERLRVERPEYEDEDDETLLIDSFADDGGDTE